MIFESVKDYQGTRSWWLSLGIFSVRYNWESVHTGIGYDIGDGVNITRKCLQFGKPSFFKITTKIIAESKEKRYIFKLINKNFWEEQDKE